MRGETGPDSGVRTQRRTLGPNTLGKILSSPVLTRKNYPAAFSQIAFSEYLANTVFKVFASLCKNLQVFQTPGRDRNCGVRNGTPQLVAETLRVHKRAAVDSVSGRQTGAP